MSGVRRTITVVFTDLVGSTKLLAGMEAAAAEALLRQHFAGLRDALSVHRGVEVKTLGDGMMAVFDSVSDAVACAVTMQRSVQHYGRRISVGEVAMRVGVSVGEAMVEHGDYFGQPVVEASRLCAEAGPGGILIGDLVRVLAGSTGVWRLVPIGELELKGLAGPMVAWRVDWDAAEEFALRVALADDSVLLRQGIAKVLEGEGIEVPLQASDSEGLFAGLRAARPHVVVLDVRMPPTHTTEGLDAAERIRAEHPEMGVLVLSASVEPGAARRLLESDSGGIGYLLKERVADIDELVAAIRTVASGGSAIDPHVIARLAA
jgi:class 3 adenylate cyclase/ActR/RegA family two-component response regulator